METFPHSIVSPLVFCAALAGTAACQQQEAPAAKVGQEIVWAIDKAGQKIDKAADKIAAQIENAADKALQSERAAAEFAGDTMITAKVKAAIFEAPGLKSVQIGVDTHSGAVQLSGFVTSVAEKTAAGNLARQVKGVQTVKNDIQLT